jgi:hypothetical protein
VKTEQQTTNPARQNDTAKSAASKQALLREFVQIAERVRGDFSQERVYVRMMVLALGMICAMARHTLSQGIVGVGQEHRDWSGWYRLFSRRRVWEEDLAQRLFEETLRDAPKDQPYVTGVDATHIPRSSRKFPGAGWAKSPRGPPWMPALHQAQRFLTCAWFPPLAKGYTRAIVLRLLSAFTPKSAPAGEDKQLDWDVALKFAEWVRQGLDTAGRAGQLVVMLMDGAFDKLGVWRGLPERCVAIIRTAKNRALRLLPEPHAGRGRPRLYGPKAPKPHEYLKERQGWKKSRVEVRGRIYDLRSKLVGCFLRESVPDQPVYLLVIGGADRITTKGRRRRYRCDPTFYLINAIKVNGVWELPLSHETILAWVWQRWELEVAHRAMKSNFGVGEMQCWNKHAAILSVQWMGWLYGVLMLAAYRLWGWTSGPAIRTAWWSGSRYWSFNTVLRVFRFEAYKLSEFRELCLGSLQNRPNILGHWSVFLNSVLGTARA